MVLIVCLTLSGLSRHLGDSPLTVSATKHKHEFKSQFSNIYFWIILFNCYQECLQQNTCPHIYLIILTAFSLYSRQRRFLAQSQH